ncbi:unnamed protein product [Linum trigynum]|uniref:Uncharacterized protein n=1 Tax=Linum trigynum TaxID=586398 RepID=A0AAV2GN73_9ROSI
MQAWHESTRHELTRDKQRTGQLYHNPPRTWDDDVRDLRVEVGQTGPAEEPRGQRAVLETMMYGGIPGRAVGLGTKGKTMGQEKPGRTDLWTEDQGHVKANWGTRAQGCQ